MKTVDQIALEAKEWDTDALDPSNWLVVPEFGVSPRDVGSTGFANPIVYPGAPMRETRIYIRELVGHARTLIAKDCPTLSDQRKLVSVWLDVVDAGKVVTRAQQSAMLYQLVISQLSMALKQLDPATRTTEVHEIDPKTGDEVALQIGPAESLELAIQTSMFAASLLVEWAMNAPISKAQMAAFARIAKDADGKQAAKAQVHECWLEWKAKPSRYKSNARFAIDMLEKYPALESAKVIEGWCTAWSKKADGKK